MRLHSLFPVVLAASLVLCLYTLGMGSNMGSDKCTRTGASSNSWLTYGAKQAETASQCIALSQCHDLALWAWSSHVVGGRLKWPEGPPRPPRTVYSSARQVKLLEFELEYGQERASIPLVLHMTLKSKQNVPDQVQKYINKWKKAGFRVILYDDDEMNGLIASHLPLLADDQRLEKIPVATRSDILRYLVVWLFGGFWGDVDLDVLTDALASQWPVHNVSFVVSLEAIMDYPSLQRRGVQFAQFWFGAVARHPILRNLLDGLIERRLEIWNATGDVVLYGLGTAGPFEFTRHICEGLCYMRQRRSSIKECWKGGDFGSLRVLPFGVVASGIQSREKRTQWAGGREQLINHKLGGGTMIGTNHWRNRKPGPSN
jgi:hypothetical protein